MYNQADNRIAGTGQVSSAYGAPATAAPRELRIMERVDGLRNGIDEMASRLEMFISRLQNAPPPGNAEKAPMPPMGLPETIATAEARLRYCIETITKINEAF